MKMLRGKICSLNEANSITLFGQGPNNKWHLLINVRTLYGQILLGILTMKDIDFLREE